MKKTRYIIFALLIAITSLTGCKKESKLKAKAMAQAQNAAKELIAVDHTDTFALENKILEIKSIQSEYVLLGDSDAVNAFDNAFKEYIQQHDSSLAKSMF